MNDQTHKWTVGYANQHQQENPQLRIQSSKVLKNKDICLKISIKQLPHKTESIEIV